MVHRRHTRFGSARRQVGATLLGYIILVIFIGVFAFGFIRLTPVYLNYMKVVGVVDGVFEEFDGQNPTRVALRNSISRRFDVESVGVISFRDVSVTQVDGGFEVSAVYDHTTPFIGNISFTVHFDKTRLVRR
ncbi:MAG: DUF4845 domain-containing protein [Woeseiaceae bacterium]|nr:DUF4845 domain-containing protein [Woeseiaceae bacterium]